MLRPWLQPPQTEFKLQNRVPKHDDQVQIQLNIIVPLKQSLNYRIGSQNMMIMGPDTTKSGDISSKTNTVPISNTEC